MSRLDDWNYYGDHRVRAAERGNWYSGLDESRRIATVILFDDNGDEEEVEVPIKFEVCETCDGRGRHVNPSIDAGGLSAEDFAEDPDFSSDYMSGRYDVACYGCGGKRVQPQIDTDKCKPEILQRLRKQQEEDDEFRRLQEAERRMGA